MDQVEAAALAEKLYRKYVGKGSIDLERLYNVVLREKRAAEEGRIQVSQDLLRELRVDVRKVRSLLNRPHLDHLRGLGAFPDDYNIEFRVHEGQPSWHQRRAGHRSAGVTTGFKTREAAEEFAAKLRKNSGVSAWIEEVHSKKELGDLPRWVR